MELKNIQGLHARAAILVVACHFHDFADRYGFRSEALITIGAWGGGPFLRHQRLHHDYRQLEQICRTERI